MFIAVMAKLSTYYLTALPSEYGQEPAPSRPQTEPGFEIAQSMGIALLGLVVAAAFATALQAL
ncbi:MAG: hypothetical protein GY773_06495, partial [Actinomycetia bacterium]|nr:hypothetical protein [Actinomycetes bacterium]